MRQRHTRRQNAEAQQQAQTQNQAQVNDYSRAYSACLEGRGYTVK
jgi:hypothetical protein